MVDLFYAYYFAYMYEGGGQAAPAFSLFSWTDALSPESQQSMEAAMEAMAKSKAIRKEIVEVIDHTHRMQIAAHSAVNEGLVRKLAQTVTLTVRT